MGALDNLGKNITVCRKKAGITQEQLAEQLLADARVRKPGAADVCLLSLTMTYGMTFGTEFYEYKGEH